MMTVLAKPPEQVDAKQFDQANTRIRVLIISVAVLAVALIGFGIWVVYDQNTVSETAVTEEIQTLLDDYTAALNSYDLEAILGLVTAGYTLREVTAPFDYSRPATAMGVHIDYLAEFEVRIVTIGEPIMAGDGPWYVSQVDSYTSLANPEGDDGVSTFTIIDVAGTPMIDMHVRASNN